MTFLDFTEERDQNCRITRYVGTDLCYQVKISDQLSCGTAKFIFLECRLGTWLYLRSILKFSANLKMLDNILCRLATY